MTGNHRDAPYRENDRGKKNGLHSSGGISSGRNMSFADIADMDSDERSISQETLDLLVDGELGENDRRELLLRMDRAVDGWRKCALTFIEAQLFRQSFRSHEKTRYETALSFEPDVPVDESEREKTEEDLQKIRDIRDNVHIVTAWEGNVPERGMRLSRHSAVWKSIATVACLCMIALVSGGISVHWWESEHFSQGEPFFSGQTRAVHTPYGMFGSMMSPTSETMPINFDAVVPNTGFDTTTPNMEYVSFSLGDPNMLDEQVPCFSSRDVDSLQYLKMPPNISAAELREIKQSGGDVDVKRSHLVVPAGPGRHAIIPVDQVDIHYASKKLL